MNEVCKTQDLSKYRLVSKEWKGRIDDHLSKHLQLDVSYVPGSSHSDLRCLAQAASKPYLYFMGITSLNEGVVRTRGGVHHVDMFTRCRVLEVVDRTKTAHAVNIGMPQTVRLIDSHLFEKVLTYAHVPRLICWGTPLLWEATGFTNYEPEPVKLARSKMVLNLRWPQYVSVDIDFGDTPRPAEVVIIFHPWGPGKDEDAQTILQCGGEPRYSAAAIALWALSKKARTTIVNVEQLNFLTDEAEGSWVGSEYASEKGFKDCLEDVMWSQVPDDIHLDLDDVRYLTTAEYVAGIGPEEFELETMLDHTPRAIEIDLEKASSTP